MKGSVSLLVRLLLQVTYLSLVILYLKASRWRRDEKKYIYCQTDAKAETDDV